METKEWRFIDKKDWGDGPWLEEPDKIQWEDEVTKLPCIVRRNGEVTGALCGYVGVPEGHPWFDKDYDDIEVEVHGGLTYAGVCQDEDKERGICHVAEDGIKRYWLGFDCSHFMDLSPRIEFRERRLFAGLSMPQNIYRTVEYVKSECANLAGQIAGATRKENADG